MQIKIEMIYGRNTNHHFFEVKNTIRVVPAGARVVILNEARSNSINDELEESERAAIITLSIDNKTDFERVSSAVLEKFVAHLKENYPNLKSIVDYNEKSLDNLIQINKLKEDILQKEHGLLPQLIQRICANNSIKDENKIQVLGQLKTFLQNATEQQLNQFENKISQLDERPYYFQDLIKSIGSIVVGWSVGLGFFWLAFKGDNADAAGIGFAFGLISIGAGSVGGCKFGLDFLNGDAEDIHYPENNKIAAIGTICSKM